MTTTISSSSIVREIALGVPGALRVFDAVRVDYCCGGNRTLEEACVKASASVSDVLARIEQERKDAALREAGPALADTDLRGLIRHILDTHHVYERSAMAHITPLMAKVRSRHGARHGELAQISAVYTRLVEDLQPHFLKEEQVLFPYVEGMEAAKAEGRTAAPLPFGSFANPIRMMHVEHDAVGSMLHELRALTTDYTPPADACASYQGLFKALAEFDLDIIHHVHLENNVLFPRVLELASPLPQQ